MLDIRHNVAEVRKGLRDVQRQHLPFAVSLALNEVVKGARVHITRRLSRVLDRPVAFTKRAVNVQLSSKRNLRAAVFIMDLQARYLIWQETGGTRPPKGQAVPVPYQIKLNASGNMAKGAIARALARKDTFATKPGSKLPGGIYRRTGGKRTPGIKMLVAFEPAVTYAKRPLEFGKTVARFAADRLPGALTRALSRALSPRP